MATGQRRSSMRERFREQVREDVKAVALEQLAEGGAQTISLNAIAKRLGVSGPALYRYYANRDELLNELVIDAYHDLRDALASASAGSARVRRPEQRMRELAHAYRQWAREHPHRYELLFRPPFPGYDAHAEPIAEAASTLMLPVLDVLDGNEDDDVQYVVRVWSRMHGIVSLELGGAYTAMDIDADALYADEMQTITERYHREPEAPDGVDVVVNHGEVRGGGGPGDPQG
ncbi:TetR/AcrR family transcriptional regulator [Nonomuraea sp. KC401]|uniref:TetR/AcrR family transcriptional regulator n=1 Tax=unclassified Nonomuraea TaxID=2593643 RepID=UPI0010FEEE20|nr:MULTISPECIES: TetR/AcrR family transcriptional regulator [unclassified Nonomuraea]NBE93237.1 TetR family transcriptional regulator [Nonomuraea sp. K271]TLF78023.1 TetR/AcrR family transcriptional regulator [Nonomuraea sp. KC401]